MSGLWRSHLKYGAAAIILLVALPAWADSITATGVSAHDGATLIIDERMLPLSGIAAPAIGFTCAINGHELDCGNIARTALLDLLAGAEVVCKPDDGKWRCRAGGFDLAANMVHTGWAVPLADDDPRFVAALQRAQTRKQGLWKAEPGLTIGDIRAAAGD